MELLGRLLAGDAAAGDAPFAAAYSDLHRFAEARLRELDNQVMPDPTGA